ncbi:MAG: DUF6152 family protein [Gammaproteobacteria bacterium]
MAFDGKKSSCFRKSGDEIGCALIAILLVAFSHQSGAHHSPAEFDLATTVSFDAIVTEFEWKNPHVFIQVDRIDGDGRVTPLQIEADGVSMLLPHRWSRDSLVPGDRVTVVAYPSRRTDGRSLLGYSITKQDGLVLAPNPDRFQATEPVRAGGSASIEGVWLPRWDAFFGLSSTRRQPTEELTRFWDGPESAQLPLYECMPFSAPRIMVIPVRSEIEVSTDRILIRVDWLDVERVIYLDGRDHPADGSWTAQGHSVGGWDGDTLVIDTMLFSPDSMGDYSLPSGPDRHIEERLSLSDNGESLSYEFVLEDPEYLAAPLSGGGVWDYRPDLEPSAVDCDLEAAQRNLETTE